MAKDRISHGHSTGFNIRFESEGSGSSGRIDTEVMASEVSSGRGSKCKVFGARKQVHLLAELSRPERNELIRRLKSELEQVQNLQKKFEVETTNVVAHSSSSDLVRCSAKQKKPTTLTHGPGKILNPSSSQKARGYNRGNLGRFEAQITAPLTTLDAVVFKQCENLLKKLMSHPYAWVFNTPVDVVKLNIPDYLIIIKQPMDLGTIKRKIVDLEYSHPTEFHADVKLTFSNAMAYNPPGHDVYLMADTLNKFFDARWKLIDKKLNANKSKPLPEEPKEMIVKPMPPAKKRKVTSTEQKIKPASVERKITDAEKQELGRDLEALLGDLPEKIVEFLKKQSSNRKESGDGEDEIEIDIDELSDDTLLTLRKLVDEHLQEKQNLAKAAEPCEIESYSNSVLQLLNESGLSNSSTQLPNDVVVSDLAVEDVNIGVDELPMSNDPPIEKENHPVSGLAEEDANVCGEELPVSSEPPVEIENHTGSGSGISDNQLDDAKASDATKHQETQELSDPQADLVEDMTVDNLVEEPQADLVKEMAVDNLVEGPKDSVSGLEQHEQNSQLNPDPVDNLVEGLKESFSGLDQLEQSSQLNPDSVGIFVEGLKDSDSGLDQLEQHTKLNPDCDANSVEEPKGLISISLPEVPEQFTDSVAEGMSPNVTDSVNGSDQLEQNSQLNPDFVDNLAERPKDADSECEQLEQNSQLNPDSVDNLVEGPEDFVSESEQYEQKSQLDADAVGDLLERQKDSDSGLEQPVSELEQPVGELEQPVGELEQSVSGFEQPDSGLEQPDSGLEQPELNSQQNPGSVANLAEGVKDSVDGSEQKNSQLNPDSVGEIAEEPKDCVSGLDQLEQNSKLNPDPVVVDRLRDVESAPRERQVSPDKLYRAALLRNRFADTILKAKEKALNQDEKGDPEQLRREREELELEKKKEKARLQIEAKAAEEAQRRAEAEAAAEAKRKRELEREEARQALLKMERTVEINENSKILEDLEMLRGVPNEQMVPSPINDTTTDDGFGNFKFGGGNALEQLGLYMKMDEDDEEGEPPSTISIIPTVVNDEVEEGEID
jgi:hypothetical protein